MALINCPECGKEISDTIESCIHCGFVLNKKEEKPSNEQIPLNTFNDSIDLPGAVPPSVTTETPKETSGCVKVFCILLAAILLVCIGFAVATTSSQDIGANSSTTTTTKAPAPEIDPIAIFADYHKNEITAEEKHIGRRYKITDVRISKISEDYVYITQKIDIGEYSIKLIFDKSQLDYVKTLETGDTVTCEGVLTNILFGSVFTPELTLGEVVFVQESE